MHCTVIIPAAGVGTRFGGETPKQYVELDGVPIIVRTIERFLRYGLAERIIVATAEGDRWWPEIRESRRWEGVESVRGGATRQESVHAALREVGDEGVVAIHDAVRPYFRRETLASLIEAAERQGAAIPALPVRETIHRVNEDRRIGETLDRSTLWAAQTPQCFRADLIGELMERAWHEGFSGTDEAALVARYDRPVAVLEGDRGNIKITTTEDLLLIGPFVNRGFE